MPTANATFSGFGMYSTSRRAVLVDEHAGAEPRPAPPLLGPGDGRPAGEHGLDVLGDEAERAVRLGDDVLHRRLRSEAEVAAQHQAPRGADDAVLLGRVQE